MPKISSYGGMTPILTDLLYGVDDPGGTPISNSITIAALRTLIEANLTTAVASVGYNISTDVKLVRDAAATLAQRDTTTAQAFNIYNTWTDASNYERLSLNWATNVINITSESLGTGTDRKLNFVVGNGQTIEFGTSGARLRVSNTAVTLLSADLIVAGNYMEMTEMSAPGAGAANTGRLYLDVTGAKTKLMVIFQTGGAIELAIEA